MKYDAVIVAAGLSSRAGGFKPLFKLKDKTVIESAISPFLEICSKVIVVVGYRGKEISNILDKYNKVEIIYNERYEEGMFSSIKTGVDRVESDYFFLMPGDYPLIDFEICKDLMHSYGLIRIPTCEKRKGHPILIDSSLKKEIILCGLKSMRDFLGLKKIHFVEMNTRRILLDLDTREDYKGIINEMEKSYEKRK